MFSYLNFILYDDAAFEMATLIRVQNLFRTATDFRKKWHIWDLHRIFLPDKIQVRKYKIKQKMNVMKNIPNI
jgi:hypothetical protein